MIWAVKGWLAEVLKDMPEGLRVMTELVWKVRWFLFAGWVVYLVTQILPYLVVGWVVKSLFSFFL